MRKFIVIIATLCCSIAVYAQSPTPDPDTLRDPVKQIDPEVKQPPARYHDANEVVRINASELPPAVQESLKNAEYTGWQKSVVYKHKSDNTYTIEVREGGENRVYRFTAGGKLIGGKKPKNPR